MRSILFLPTDKIERLPKALGSGADKVIFDLEDGLAHDKKALGRSNFADLANRNFDGQPDKFLLRINALDTDEYQDDIKMLKSLSTLPYSIAIPKIESADECRTFLKDLGLEWAKGVLEEAKTAGTGAFKYQGKMVDAPVLAVARQIISRED